MTIETGAQPTVERWWPLLHYAVMAPSGHNTQPWLFRLNGNTADLYQDRSRWLAAVDPHGRELVMSCGAALLNLRIAAAHSGIDTVTKLLPDPDDPDLLARVRLAGEIGVSETGEALFDAIAQRRTNRFRFRSEPIPESVLSGIETAAEDEGTWLVIVRSVSDRKRIAGLIAEGDRLQAADPDIRRELAAWVRSNSSPRRDGLRGYSFGHGRISSRLAPLYIKYANWGDSQADADQELAVSAPALAVIGTDNDSREDWLQAGQAVARVLLTAQAAGVSASFFNQPVEVSALRERLRTSVAASGYPQLCFRLGYGKEVLPTARRPVEEVVVEAI